MYILYFLFCSMVTYYAYGAAVDMNDSFAALRALVTGFIIVPIAFPLIALLFFINVFRTQGGKRHV